MGIAYTALASILTFALLRLRLYEFQNIGNFWPHLAITVSWILHEGVARRFPYRGNSQCVLDLFRIVVGRGFITTIDTDFRSPPGIDLI